MLDLFISKETDIFVWISYILSVALVVFLSTPVHEFAHAITAVKLGDPTPKYTGRTTINPFAHIDNFGALLILLFGFGWAKPVRVNARNFKNPKRDMALTAIAGPISNLIVAFVFYVIHTILFSEFLYEIYFGNEIIRYILLFLKYVVQINVSLAVFNLIPIPPLDGSKLLASLLPDRIYYNLMQYERYFSFILILLVATGALAVPMSYITNAIYSFFDLLTFWI